MWEGRVGRTFGKGVWEGRVGRTCGKDVWEGHVGRKCGKDIWKGRVGRTCGSHLGLHDVHGPRDLVPLVLVVFLLDDFLEQVSPQRALQLVGIQTQCSVSGHGWGGRERWGKRERG